MPTLIFESATVRLGICNRRSFYFLFDELNMKTVEEVCLWLRANGFQDYEKKFHGR